MTTKKRREQSPRVNLPHKHSPCNLRTEHSVQTNSTALPSRMTKCTLRGEGAADEQGRGGCLCDDVSPVVNPELPNSGCKSPCPWPTSRSVSTFSVYSRSMPSSLTTGQSLSPSCYLSVSPSLCVPLSSLLSRLLNCKRRSPYLIRQGCNEPSPLNMQCPKSHPRNRSANL